MLRLLPPWAYAAIAAVLLASGFAGGWRVQGWRCDAAKTAALVKAQKQFDAKLAKIQDEAKTYEHDREAGRVEAADREARIRTIYRDIAVPTGCAAPDAVGGLLDDAVRSANARAGGQSGAGLPAAAVPAKPAD